MKKQYHWSLDRLAFAEDIAQLKAEFQEAGLFVSSKVYYTFKVLFNYALLGLSMYLLFAKASQGSWIALIVSALFLGLFWQQSGWLAHDFLHHQVFRNRSWNNAMGFLLGNINQGFSVGWWKDKHNS